MHLLANASHTAPERFFIGKHAASSRAPGLSPASVHPGSANSMAVIQRKAACACGGGCPRCQQDSSQPDVQAKLAVSSPGDAYEQEADRIADQVTSTPGPVAQRSCSSCSSGNQPCSKCESEAPVSIQRRAAPAASISQPSAHGGFTAVPGSGQPLHPVVQTDMEARFGHDFSGVRVHADAQASESAKEINALAYTVGRDIVFRSTHYAPETDAGRRLLAHELTHVIQQSGSGESRGARVDHDSAPNRPMIMRAFDKAACEKDCGNQFEDCTKKGEATQCQAQLSSCLRGCAAQAEPEQPQQPEPPKEKPKAKDGIPEVCDPPPKGPGKHPDKVSKQLLARMMSKDPAKDGDPGEFCMPTPYVASPGESVCTIGYGHQIKDCPILDKDGNPVTSLTKDERKALKKSDLTCECAGKISVDCKGSQAEEWLKSDARGKFPHIKKVLPVDLNQDEFDAMVDMSLSHGSIPPDLADAVKKYWCTIEGKNYVREIYLKTMIREQNSDKISKGLAKRRQLRVWPKY